MEKVVFSRQADLQPLDAFGLSLGIGVEHSHHDDAVPMG
jgi:hypothetical protein